MATPRSVNPKCSATSRQTGERCRNFALPGLSVCRFHGGSAPRARAVVETARANRELSDLRDPVTPVADPTSELLNLAGRSLRVMELLEEKVSELSSVRYATPHGEQTRGELLAYERSLDRCARVLEGIVRLDLDARMVRVNELQALAVVAAVDAALRAGGVVEGSPAWDEARAAAAECLRRVTA